MALVRRQLRLTFQLGTGSFGTDGSNKAVVQDLRMTAKIIKAGGNSKSVAQLQVWGMSLSEMNKLSTLGMIATTYRRNTLLIEAGDDPSNMAAVFQGTITNAWVDLSQAPDVAFQVEAHTGLFDAIAPAPPTSYKGAADVATVLSGLATRMGLSFRNNGVTAQLSHSYFQGTLWEQARYAVQHAGIEWSIENNTLYIWPSGSTRDNGASILLDKNHGMIRSPTFDSQGIRLQCLFNSSIGYGTRITVKSILDGANGDWKIYMLDYDLQTQLPKGKWEMNIAATRLDHTVVA